MSSMISWNLQTAVKEGHLDEARALASDMVASTQSEAGTVGYEWFLTADGTALHINEHFVDSEAALTHLGMFGSQFADRFMTHLQPEALHVYGDPSDSLRKALDGLGAKYYGALEGFRR